jgi:hypothetical protein
MRMSGLATIVYQIVYMMAIVSAQESFAVASDFPCGLVHYDVVDAALYRPARNRDNFHSICLVYPLVGYVGVRGHLHLGYS